jgi:hypothetical protein
MKELRNYIFQTDTTDTSNSKLPWKNKTSIPKITQIRDNLHANYLAALFPNDNWFKWEADKKDGLSAETARKIEAYMKQKIRESGFKLKIGELLYDYIDYGNAFGEVAWSSQAHTTSEGVAVTTYSGPVLHRISPYDIYFDLSAGSFKDSGKITRTVVSMGSLVDAFANDPAFGWVEAALLKARDTRVQLSAYGDSDLDKAEGYNIDGFGSLRDYYSSGMVELLEFEGDTYNAKTGEVQTNRRIIVVDRKIVALDEPINSWIGRSNKEHVGWRIRPDNLMAMGPLDNLVGMQYRLDHLENLKADVFDQIALPVVYQRGMVEDWDWGPGARIYGDADSDVKVLSPDPTALNADFQKDTLMRDMEQLAGAPREAMGIRTPGEKTAFEVAELQNAAGRLFQQKISYFEEMFVEPLLNQMLESARRNLSAPVSVRAEDEDLVVKEFITVTADDLNKAGKIYPMGARHFAAKAQIVQNLLGLINSGAYADPAVSTHISGLRIAELMEENLGLDKHDLVEPNIRVAEAQETQQLVGQVQEEQIQEIADQQFADEVEDIPEG